MTTSPLNDLYIERIKHNISCIQHNVAVAAAKANRNPDDITIMAVTKTVAPEYVNIAIDYGITLLGENRAQELLDKYTTYSLNFEKIHFIGHLQRNKVKSIIDKVSMIESVDSVELAGEIDKQAKKLNIIMPILIEVNIAMQETKSGFSPGTLLHAVACISKFENLSVQGLMTIPPKERTEEYFKRMQQLYFDIQEQNISRIQMNVLSMGMSADYAKAVEYGANIIRIGSGLFGKR